MKAPKHDVTSMPRTTGSNRNLNSVQFGTGTRASGKVNRGMNPFTYEGGAHRKPGRLG